MFNSFEQNNPWQAPSPESILQSEDAWEILGVPKSAPHEEIEYARKKLMMSYHPDRSAHEQAHAITVKIQQAYDQLNESQSSTENDRPKKHAHDRQSNQNTEQGPSAEEKFRDAYKRYKRWDESQKKESEDATKKRRYHKDDVHKQSHENSYSKNIFDKIFKAKTIGELNSLKEIIEDFDDINNLTEQSRVEREFDIKLANRWKEVISKTTRIPEIMKLRERYDDDDFFSISYSLRVEREFDEKVKRLS